MANIRINDLSPDTSPANTDVVAIDGPTTRKSTLAQIVSAGRPLANQTEAEAGTDPSKAMTPLTVKQAIDALGGAQFATAAQGAKADTALQPAAIGATVQAYSDMLSSVAGLSYSNGDLIYAGGASSMTRLAIAPNGYFLMSDGSTPVWSSSGPTGMLASVYDPQNISNDVFDRANHTGTQAISTVSGLQDALDSKPTGFATKAAAEAYAPASAPDFIRTAGYTSAGDGGGTLYKKVVSEPSHAGKFSITLSDAVTVVWYEIAPEIGAITANAFSTINLAVACAEAIGADLVLDRAYSVGSAITLSSGNVEIIFREGAKLVPTLAGYEASGGVALDLSGADNVRFRGQLEIDGSNVVTTSLGGAGAASFRGILLSDQSDVYFEDVYIHDLTAKGAYTDFGSYQRYMNVGHGITFNQNIGNVTFSGTVRIENTSGAGLFFNLSTENVYFQKLILRDNYWYPLHFDNGANGIYFDDVYINYSGTEGCFWGAMVDIMSQNSPLYPRNQNIYINRIKCRGYAAYGGVFRIASCENITIRNYDIKVASGSDSVGGDLLTVFRLVNRGDASTDNGPINNVTIEDGVVEAIGTNNVPFYMSNNDATAGAVREPSSRISFRNTEIVSPDSSNYFYTLAWIHGNNSGAENVFIEDNYGTVRTKAGVSLGGVIAAAATNEQGKVDGLYYGGNQITDESGLETSVSVAVQFSEFVDNVFVTRPNIWTGFFYKTRTLSGAGPTLVGLDKDIAVDLKPSGLEYVFAVTPLKFGGNVTYTTALPTSGMYQRPHRFLLPEPSASASPGWELTADGAFSAGAWASGQGYVAGVWRRNASNRVYELITAGGGTTANEPVHTTKGQDVDGGDGYVWRCRSVVHARAATIAALGAAVALP